MVSHEHFWADFLGVPSSFMPYIPFPQCVTHAVVIAKLGARCAFYMSNHDCALPVKSLQN